MVLVEAARREHASPTEDSSERAMVDTPRNECEKVEAVGIEDVRQREGITIQTHCAPRKRPISNSMVAEEQKPQPSQSPHNETIRMNREAIRMNREVDLMTSAEC